MRGTRPTAGAAHFDAAAVAEIAENLKGLDGPLLPILHALTDRFGYVDEQAVPIVAEVLNLSRAEVHGVVGFYHDFRREPAGQHLVKVCCAEACQSMGSDNLVAGLEQAWGIRLGETTTDRRITLEAVYCLGNCALSPSVLVDDTLLGRANPDRVLAQARKAGP